MSEMPIPAVPATTRCEERPDPRPASIVTSSPT